MYKNYHMIQFKLPKLLIEALILIRYINNLYCFYFIAYIHHHFNDL